MNDYVVGWLAVGVLLITLEFLIPGAVMSFLGIACLAVGILMQFDVISGVTEILMTWFLLSIFLIVVVRSFFLRFLPGDTQVDKTDEDEASIGTIVTVHETIHPERRGRIRFLDSTWEAESEHTIHSGENAIIVQRRGNIWVVKPID